MHDARRILQLDLFPAEALPPPAAPAPPPAPGIAAPPPRPHVLLTPRPPALPDNARWRSVDLPGGQALGFVLRRSRRRTIGLAINDDGLQVTAPAWATLAQIDGAVIEKSGWVLGKLQARQARQAQLAVANSQWRNGGRIPYLGKPIVLRLGTSPMGSGFGGSVFLPQDGDVLCLPLPADATHPRIRDSAHAWLQARAQEWFGQRLDHFQRVSALRVSRWGLSSATTRWGSCNSEGHIRLNWRLVHFEPAIIDYVIAHEIAHLKEMNHGAQFWREVGRILPGFERARAALRQHDPASLPLL